VGPLSLITRRHSILWPLLQAIARLRKQITVGLSTSVKTSTYASRVASSTATWTLT
jgi:hypothetical protein